MNNEPTNPPPAKVPARKGGAKTKRTPERAKAIAEAIGLGLPVEAACRVAGLSPAAYHKWRASDAAFAEEIETAVARGIESRLKTVQEASRTDWRAALALLQICQPQYFSRNRVEHQHVHVSGDKVLIYLPQKGESNAKQIPIINT